jgi:hypothetical protein
MATTRPSHIPLTTFLSGSTLNYPNARFPTATEGVRVRYGVTMFRFPHHIRSATEKRDSS